MVKWIASLLISTVLLLSFFLDPTLAQGSALDLGDPFSDYLPPNATGPAGDFYCVMLGNVVQGVTDEYFWTACVIASHSLGQLLGIGIAEYTRASNTQEYVVTDSRRWILPWQTDIFGPTVLYTALTEGCFPIPFAVLYQDGDNAMIFFASPLDVKQTNWVVAYKQQSDSLTFHSMFFDNDTNSAFVPAALITLRGTAPINEMYTLYTSGAYANVAPPNLAFVYKRWSYTIPTGWQFVTEVPTNVLWETTSSGNCQITKTVQPMNNGIIFQPAAGSMTSIYKWNSLDNSLVALYQSSVLSSTPPDIIWSFGFASSLVNSGTFALLHMNKFNGASNPYQFVGCDLTVYPNSSTSEACQPTTMFDPYATSALFNSPNAQIVLCQAEIGTNIPVTAVMGMDPTDNRNYTQSSLINVVSDYFYFPGMTGTGPSNFGRMPTSFWLNTDHNRYLMGAPTSNQAIGSLTAPGGLFHVTMPGFCTPPPDNSFPVVNETALAFSLGDPFAGYASGYSCRSIGTIVKAVRPLYFWTACILVNATGTPIGVGVAQYTRTNTLNIFAVNPASRVLTPYQEGFYASAYSNPNEDAAWPLLFHVADNSQTSAWIYVASIDPVFVDRAVGRIFVYQQVDTLVELYDVVLPPTDFTWRFYPLSLDWLDTQANPSPSLVTSGIIAGSLLEYVYMTWPGGINTVIATFGTADTLSSVSIGSLARRRVYTTSTAIYARYSNVLYAEWLLSNPAMNYTTVTYFDPLTFPTLGQNFINFILQRSAPNSNFPNSQDNTYEGLFYTNQYQGNTTWNIVQQQGIAVRPNANFPPLKLDQQTDAILVTPEVELFTFGAAAPGTIPQIVITQPRLSPPQIQLLAKPILGSVPTLQTIYFPNLGTSSTPPWLGSMRTTSHIWTTNDEIVIGAPNFNNGVGALYQMRLLNVTLAAPVNPPVSPPVSPPVTPVAPPVAPPIAPQATYVTLLGLPVAYNGQVVEFTRALTATSDHFGIAAMGRALYNNRSVVLPYYQPWNGSLSYQLIGLGGPTLPFGPVVAPVTVTNTGSNWGTVRWSDDRNLLVIGAPVVNESIYVWQYNSSTDAFRLQQPIQTPPAFSTYPSGIGQAFDLTRDGFTLAYAIDTELHLERWTSLDTSSAADKFQEVQVLALPEELGTISMDAYGRCLLGGGTNNNPATLYFFTTNSTGLFGLQSMITLSVMPIVISTVTLSANCTYFEIAALDYTLYPLVMSRRYTSNWNSGSGSWNPLVEQHPAALSSLYLSDFGAWEASVTNAGSLRFVLSQRNNTNGIYNPILTMPDPTFNQTGAPAVQFLPLTTSRNGLSSDCRTLVAGHYKTDFPTLAGTGQGQVVIYILPPSTVSCQPTPVLAPFPPPPSPPVSPPPVNPPVSAPFLPPLYSPVLFPPLAPSVVILTPSSFVPVTPTPQGTYVIPTNILVQFVFYILVATTIIAFLYWMVIFVRGPRRSSGVRR